MSEKKRAGKVCNKQVDDELGDLESGQVAFPL
jgi:hypothetical protein